MGRFLRGELKQTYRLAVGKASQEPCRIIADSVQRVAYRIAFGLTEVGVRQARILVV